MLNKPCLPMYHHVQAPIQHSVFIRFRFRCKCRHFQPQEDLICDCEHFGEGSLGALFSCLRRAGGDRAGDGTLDCVTITPASGLQTLGLQCLQIEIYISVFHRRFCVCRIKYSSWKPMRMTHHFGCTIQDFCGFIFFCFANKLMVIIRSLGPCCHHS